jgi:DNA-binding response OmpR family regulator
MAVLSLRPASPDPAGSFAVTAVVVQVRDDAADLAALSTVATELAAEIRGLLTGRGYLDASVLVVPEPPGLPSTPPVRVDRRTRTITVQDRALQLVHREFELLAFLAEHPRQVFSRRQLLSTVWNGAPVGSRTVDVHVRRLRVKLAERASWLQTVRNTGYRFDPGDLPASVARAG